jgi:transposase
MLKHFNVNLRFIGKTLKRYEETGQMQPKKETPRKSTVRTNEMIKKVKWPNGFKPLLKMM